MEQAPNNFSKEKIEINIKDPDEAMDFIVGMIKNGEMPCVSVPERYLSALEKGLTPHASWIPGINGMVGTLGRDPYLPEIDGEKRKVVHIKNINIENIRPRFTGPDHSFHGVIMFDGPIDPSSIEIADL